MRLPRQRLGHHEPLGTRRHSEVLRDATGDVGQRVLHLAHELQRRHERAVAHRALQDAVAAVHHGKQVCPAHGQAEPDVAHVGEPVAPHARRAVLVQKPGCAGLDVTLPLEALDHHEAVEALREIGAGAPVGLADRLVQALEHAPEAERACRKHGARRHDDPCDLGNHHDEQRKGACELGEHARRRRHDRGGPGGDDARVIRQATHPLAGMGRLHARHVGVQHLVEHAHLERVLKRRLHTLTQEALQRLHGDDGDGDGREHDHARQKGVGCPVCGCVHQVAHDPGRVDAPAGERDLEHREGGDHPQAAPQYADYPRNGVQLDTGIHRANPLYRTRARRRALFLGNPCLNEPLEKRVHILASRLLAHVIRLDHAGDDLLARLALLQALPHVCSRGVELHDAAEILCGRARGHGDPLAGDLLDDEALLDLHSKAPFF